MKIISGDPTRPIRNVEHKKGKPVPTLRQAIANYIRKTDLNDIISLKNVSEITDVIEHAHGKEDCHQKLKEYFTGLFKDRDIYQANGTELYGLTISLANLPQEIEEALADQSLNMKKLRATWFTAGAMSLAGVMALVVLVSKERYTDPVDHALKDLITEFEKDGLPIVDLVKSDIWDSVRKEEPLVNLIPESVRKVLGIVSDIDDRKFAKELEAALKNDRSSMREGLFRDPDKQFVYEAIFKLGDKKIEKLIIEFAKKPQEERKEIANKYLGTNQ